MRRSRFGRTRVTGHRALERTRTAFPHPPDVGAAGAWAALSRAALVLDATPPLVRRLAVPRVAAERAGAAAGLRIAPTTAERQLVWLAVPWSTECADAARPGRRLLSRKLGTGNPSPARLPT